MKVIEQIDKQITELQKKKEAIQNECSHPLSALEINYRSDTGNYDPSSDKYWKDMDCGLCGKHWTEDQ